MKRLSCFLAAALLVSVALPALGASPDVQVVVADFCNGCDPAGRFVQLTPNAVTAPDDPANLRGTSDSNGQITFTAVPPGFYLLAIYGVGVESQMIHVPSASGTISASGKPSVAVAGLSAPIAIKAVAAGTNVTAVTNGDLITISAQAGGGGGSGTVSNAAALTSGRVILGQGNGAVAVAAASGAVPIDADGSATTFAQVNALAPGFGITNGNRTAWGNSNTIIMYGSPPGSDTVQDGDIMFRLVTSQVSPFWATANSGGGDYDMVYPAGGFQVGGGFTTDPGAGNIRANGLTASRVVLSDSNKILSSAAASGAVPINADGSATTAAQLSTASRVLTNSIGCSFSGGGSALSPGAVATIPIPFNCTLLDLQMVSYPAGAAVLDLKDCSISGTTMTVGSSIVNGGTAPTITATANAYSDTSLTSWTTSLTAKHQLQASVTSCTTITNLALILRVTHAP
jgi:hypothetical protein